MPVTLFPSHHDFKDSTTGVELTKEMLWWSIKTFEGSDKVSIQESFYRNMFQALLNFGKFQSRVSVGFNLEKQIMYPGGECCIDIYMKEVLVASFSSEECNDKIHLPYVGRIYHPEVLLFPEVPKWSPGDWKSFFAKQINEKCSINIQNAHNHINELNEQIITSEAIKRQILCLF